MHSYLLNAHKFENTVQVTQSTSEQKQHTNAFAKICDINSDWLLHVQNV